MASTTSPSSQQPTTGDREVWYQRGGIWIVGQCYQLIKSIADTHKRTLADDGQIRQADSCELEGRYLHIEIIEWIDFCHHKGRVYCLVYGTRGSLSYLLKRIEIRKVMTSIGDRISSYYLAVSHLFKVQSW